MSKTHPREPSNGEDEEVEIEIRGPVTTDGYSPDVVPPSPTEAPPSPTSGSSGKKKTSTSFFRFAPRSTAIDATDEEAEVPQTMRSRVTNFLRLPNSAIKETWSRLDLDMPEEFRENLKEMLAVDIEQDEVGEARDGRFCKFIHETLFGNTTDKGKIAGIILLVMITLSVFLAVIDSVHQIREEMGYGDIIYGFEVFFTIVFAIEYALRVYCLRRPREYVWSAMGIVDLSSILPTFITFFLPQARQLADLATLRIFRVIRVFRVLRLVRFVDAARALKDNVDANKLRVAVFMFFVFSMIIVIGCAMYLIEGEHNGFTNIPVSLYWAVVTLTTVGYGDIAPQTVPGRLLAAIVMFSGYGVIACPLVLNTQTEEEALRLNCECPRCFRRLHQDDANFCRHCGTALRMPMKKQRRLRKKKSQGEDGTNSEVEMVTTGGAAAVTPVEMTLEPPQRREIPTGAEQSM